MAAPTIVRRGSAPQPNTTNVTQFNVTGYTYTWGTNTAIASGDRVLWVAVVAIDGSPTLSVNAGSAAGWTKQGQASDGTSAVTGAVFTLETTTAFAASALPTLIIDSTASEQISINLWAFLVGSGKSVGFLLATAATGSSTNSDPPSLTNSTAASQDFIVVATRSGDSTTVATVAPTNYSNLTTATGAGTNAASTNTASRSITVAAAASENPGTFTSATEQWVSYTFGVYEFGAGFTMTAASGSFVLTGTAAGLTRGLKLTAAGGAYTLTGTAASLYRKLIAAGGSYLLTGTAAALKRGLLLTAAGGSYTLAGTAAALKKGFALTAAGGSYVLSGTAAGLKAARLLAAAGGSYLLTGTAAALKRGLKIAAAGGSYVLTGTAATLSKTTLNAYRMIAGPFRANLAANPTFDSDAASWSTAGTITWQSGPKNVKIQRADAQPSFQGLYQVMSTPGGGVGMTFSFDFVNALGLDVIHAGDDNGVFTINTTNATSGTFSGSFISLFAGDTQYFGMGLSSGAIGDAIEIDNIQVRQVDYALTGSAVNLVLFHGFGAGSGAYVLTGSAAGLLYARRMPAAGGAYTLTGTAALLTKGPRMTALGGAYSLTGTAAGLRTGRRLVAAGGTYALTGSAASLRFWKLVAAGGTYSLTGTAALFLYGKRMPAGAGAYVLTGSAVSLRVGKRLIAAGGGYVLTGSAVSFRRGRTMLAASGAYVLTGTVARYTLSGDIIRAGGGSGGARVTAFVL
jgi:hypothetical protein